jgi:CHAT domain-containing protein
MRTMNWSGARDLWLIRSGVFVVAAMTSLSSSALCQSVKERGVNRSGSVTGASDKPKVARGSNPVVKAPPNYWKSAFGQQASGQPRFRIGAFPARVDLESQPNRAGRQPDGESVTPAASDPRIELRERRDADVENAQRLVDEAYSDEALVIARRVLTAQRALVAKSDPDIATALTWFASIAKRFAQFEEARDALKEALQVRSKAHGADNWRTVDAQYALERTERLVELDEQRRQKFRAAQEVLVRSTRLKHPKPYDGAEVLLLEREALALLKEALGENHPEYAFCLDSFVENSSFLWRNSSSDAAKAIREENRLRSAQSLAIRKQSLGERHPDYALSLWNSASSTSATGNRGNPDAEALLRQILEIRAATLGKHHPAYLRTLDYLGFLVQSRPGQGLAEAEAIFREALDLGRAAYGADDPRLLMPYSRLATVAQRSGGPDEAEKMAREVFRLRRKIYAEASSAWIDTWWDLSITIPDYSTNRRAPAIARRRFLQMALLNSMRHLAQILAEKGDLAGAAQCIEETTDISVRDVASIAARPFGTAPENLNLDWRILDTYLKISFDPAAAITPYDAYRRAFAKKGAVLVYDRRVRQLRKRPDLAPLFAELESVSSETGRLGAAPPERGNAAAWRRLRDLLNRKNQLEADLADQFIRLGLTDTIAMRVEDLPAVLPAESALVDFYVVEESRNNFLAQPVDQSAKTSGNIMAPRTIIDPGAFEPHIHAFVIRKEGQIVQIDLGHVFRRSGLGFVIQSPIWQPLVPHLSGVRTVFVSPDGPLWRIGLATLPGKKPGTFLIDDMAIAVVPVPQLLVSQSPTPLSSSGLLQVGDIDFDGDPGASAATNLAAQRSSGGGDPERAKHGAFLPLPGTRFEIEAIGDLFRAAQPGSRSVMLRGSTATEGAFVAALPGSRFVHLATHGYFDQRAQTFGSNINTIDNQTPAFLAAHSPDLFAGLVFAGANRPPSPGRDDGIFTAMEAKEHDLSGVELMVLSACESSRGADTQREGMLGMQRAFHVAGVRTLISSLWRVNDGATSVLMEEFYANLWQRKLPSPEALRLAQIAVRDHPERVLRRWDELAAKSPRGLSESPSKLPSGGGAPRRSPADWWAGFVLSVGGPAAVPSAAAISGPAPAGQSQ